MFKSHQPHQGYMDQPSCSVPTLVDDDCLESWQLIGSGGFGQIHKAKHKKWRMEVAIKFLHCNDGSDLSLLKEADLMYQGGNPNVLRILGVYKGQTRGDRSAIQMGLVMEYMERGSLADLQLALNGPPPWPLAFRIINQIALGMNFLHQLNPPILHLDLKPNNVLLDDSLNAKLTDFGLAKIVKSTSKMIGEKDEEAGGTTSYMPPEAFHSSQYVPTFSSDIYSYSILLWSVITGKQPYSTVNISSLVRFRVREGDRPDLTSLDRSKTDGLGDVIDLMIRCWDSNPPKRPSFIDCIEVTDNVYELHKQHVPDAVNISLKQLNNKDKNSSSFSSPYTNTQTKNGLKEPTNPTVKTQATPTQKMGPIPTATGAALPGMHCNPAARAPPTNFKPQNMQRQYSSPSTVSICLSNVTGVQIGNNNYMNVNIQRTRQRQRHPTAPSTTHQPFNRQQNPPNIKP
ncbi:receptor-interacting serine/threonine-protein kinase 3 isoform X3 [Neoarius graeffei]|uniref:receptor-interacting serine/threonine-protein kinase 3 isoform X3 n=1 Tax=Neoarius graeffei TaxID=443677 RepID=UPI00298C7F62|nr:receptor-interacting serine/threonine-protein kinase 3 isoform X3 [Neoarius graeffei]